MRLARVTVVGMALVVADPVGSSARAQPVAEPLHRHAPGVVPPPPRWRGGADPWAWEPTQVDAIDVLYVDDLPLPLAYYVPAGGPLRRHMARPGAWYAAVFVPLMPGLPVQLWFWQRIRTHELRVFALDAPPGASPSVAVPVPLAVAGGRPVLHSAPLVLPANSSADGVFVLLEQWSVAGDRPDAVAVQARSRVLFDDDAVPWWSTRPEPAPHAPLSVVPPSPLNAPRSVERLLELPIYRRLGAAQSRETWIER